MMNEFEERAGEFVVQSSFFDFWKQSSGNREVTSRFLVAFDSLVKSFPPLIALGISRMEDAECRAVLAVNLHQECGEGDCNRSHHAIYRKFLKTSGLQELPDSEDLPATQWKKRLSDAMTRAEKPGEVLGVLAAGEFLAQPVLGALYPALKAHYPQADQEYFTTHLSLETEHMREISHLMTRQAELECGWEGILAGFDQGLSIWGEYFSGLALLLSASYARHESHGIS